MTADRITIATDMARERLAEAGLGSCQPTCAVERHDGGVDMLAVLTVSADDIDAQIKLERERGVERKAEDARPSIPMRDRDIVIEVCHDLINRAMRTERESADGYAPTWPADEDRAKERAIRNTLEESERSRAAIARVEALVERLRDGESWRDSLHLADGIEAALRGERSGQ